MCSFDDCDDNDLSVVLMMMMMMMIKYLSIYHKVSTEVYGYFTLIMLMMMIICT